MFLLRINMKSMNFKSDLLAIIFFYISLHFCCVLSGAFASALGLFSECLMSFFRVAEETSEVRRKLPAKTQQKRNGV